MTVIKNRNRENEKIYTHIQTARYHFTTRLLTKLTIPVRPLNVNRVIFAEGLVSHKVLQFTLKYKYFCYSFGKEAPNDFFI